MALTPLTQRRLGQFRANRRGYWSFWIFLFLLIFTLGAELIANDKPLVLKYKGDLYGFWNLLIILLLFSWLKLVDVVRAEFLRARNFDYVRAANALGISNPVIMWRHVLPNAMVATVTFMPFILTASITSLTALDFLGLGMPPGSPSLGELLAQGKNNLSAPWLGIAAFLSLATMLTLLTFIGEAVRDAFDPRKTTL